MIVDKSNILFRCDHKKLQSYKTTHFDIWESENCEVLSGIIEGMKKGIKKKCINMFNHNPFSLNCHVPIQKRFFTFLYSFYHMEHIFLMKWSHSQLKQSGQVVSCFFWDIELWAIFERFVNKYNINYTLLLKSTWYYRKLSTYKCFILFYVFFFKKGKLYYIMKGEED